MVRFPSFGCKVSRTIAEVHQTAMTPTEVTEKLGLLRMKDRSWYCHPSNAIEGDGLFEGALRFPLGGKEWADADITTRQA